MPYSSENLLFSLLKRLLFCKNLLRYIKKMLHLHNIKINVQRLRISLKREFSHLTRPIPLQ